MYYAIKFFAPILASPYEAANGDVVVELISDSPRDFTGTLTFQVFKLSSLTPVHTQQVPVHAVSIL